MKRYRVVVPAAWAVAISALVASVAAWAGAVPSVLRERHELPPTPALPVVGDTTGLSANATLLRDRNPFRTARKPTDVRFDPWRPVDPVPSAPVPPVTRPTLVLIGLLGGPPWNALVDGIPDRRGGVLLRLGEQSNGIRFDEVRGDTVLLAGLDTTWSLTARRIGR